MPSPSDGAPPPLRIEWEDHTLKNEPLGDQADPIFDRDVLPAPSEKWCLGHWGHVPGYDGECAVCGAPAGRAA